MMPLFTKIPIKETCEVIRERLENDKTLKKRTNRKVDNIMELLKLILETTYFRFGGEIYQQKFRVAMGSPVSPVVENLYVEDLEQKSLPQPRRLQAKELEAVRGRCHLSIHTGTAEESQHHMNTVVRFPREEKENNSTTFLDSKFTKKEDGSVKCTVHRKKTHTDQ